jgi:hypothetical protein
MRTEIVESMARAFYVLAWANAEEEKGRSHGGCELMDVAPSTARWALRYARRVAKRIEADNGAPLDVLYEKALALCTAPGAKLYTRRDPTADLFGHYLAMQAMGSGVRWSDDYPDHGVKLPQYLEVSIGYQSPV